MKHCVLASAGLENDGADSKWWYCFYQRHKIICHCCHFIRKKTITNVWKIDVLGWI